MTWASSGQWHTLMFEGQDTVDTRVVCPQDVKKMLLRQARTVRKWAAKHERGEFGLEPIQAMLRRSMNEEWTDETRNVMRKLVVERELGAEKMFRYRLVGRKDVKDAAKKKAQRSTFGTAARAGRKSEARSQIVEGTGAKNKKIKERLEVAKRNHDVPSGRRSSGNLQSKKVGTCREDPHPRPLPSRDP